MSFYNALFGMNPSAPILLGILHLTREDVGRFRDAYLNEHYIVIHTRLGGGNRECYCSEKEIASAEGHHCYQAIIEKLQAHPLYSHDVDDDFDRTYADFYFRFPEELKAELTAAAKGEQPTKPSEKWQALFAQLDAQKAARAEAKA